MEGAQNCLHCHLHRIAMHHHSKWAEHVLFRDFDNFFNKWHSYRRLNSEWSWNLVIPSVIINLVVLSMWPAGAAQVFQLSYHLQILQAWLMCYEIINYLMTGCPRKKEFRIPSMLSRSPKTWFLNEAGRPRPEQQLADNLQGSCSTSSNF